MTCPVCNGAMRITYTKGVYILWKCPYCGYVEIKPSDKVNGQRGKGVSETTDSGKKKPAQGADS